MKRKRGSCLFKPAYSMPQHCWGLVATVWKLISRPWFKEQKYLEKSDKKFQDNKVLWFFAPFPATPEDSW